MSVDNHGMPTIAGLCSSVCDDDALNEADSELLRLRKIEEAAELACGLLWMVEDRREKVRAAFHALRDALGGSGSKGLGKAIKRAIDAGHEADHPPGADWYAGKKETPNAKGQRGAACGASAAPTGCASNGNYNERTDK